MPTAAFDSRSGQFTGGAGEQSLARYQFQLQQTYEIDVPYGIDRFVLTDAVIAACLAPDTPLQDSPERLLVADDGENLEVSLFLDLSVLQRLHQDDPWQHLHPGNLSDFWLAVEGVSHFIYLLWNAGHERQISCLALELQGEVDKFVAALALVDELQPDTLDPDRLLQILFHESVLRAGLSPELQQRYQQASDLAEGFCRSLLELRSSNRLTRQLRRFYRLNQSERLRLLS